MVGLWEEVGASHVVFFNDTATTEIYTLSLHDALPIFQYQPPPGWVVGTGLRQNTCLHSGLLQKPQSPMFADPLPHPLMHSRRDRKSTRLNSSHVKRTRMPSSAWQQKNLAKHAYVCLLTTKPPNPFWESHRYSINVSKYNSLLLILCEICCCFPPSEWHGVWNFITFPQS